MPDLLIRDVPDDVIDGLDDRAQRLGLSRVELVRRLLAQQTRQPTTRMTRKDLDRFAEVCADLGDLEVMRGAWE